MLFAISSMKNFKGPIYKTIENYTRLLTNAGRWSVLLQVQMKHSGWSAESCEVSWSKRYFGLSTNTVELVRGFYSGFKNTLDIAVGLGKAVVYVGDTLAGWSKWFGLGERASFWHRWYARCWWCYYDRPHCIKVFFWFIVCTHWQSDMGNWGVGHWPLCSKYRCR